MVKKAVKGRPKAGSAKQSHQTLNVRFAEALRKAKAAIDGGGVQTWEDAQNAVFGLGGALAGMFPARSEREAFSESKEWQQIQELIAKFPRSNPIPATAESVNGRILVRVPKSVHAELLNEARREGCSLNQLCVAKLSRPLGSQVEIIPVQPQN